MTSQNAIIGDEYGIDIPVSDVDNSAIVEEKKAARFSKTKEYQRLKDHFEARIKYYQAFLPDGRTLTEVDKKEREEMWVVANAIIAEFNQVINFYETSAQIVKEAENK